MPLHAVAKDSSDERRCSQIARNGNQKIQTPAEGIVASRSPIEQALAPSQQGSRYRCEFVAAQIDNQRVEEPQNDGRRGTGVQHG